MLIAITLPSLVACLQSVATADAPRSLRRLTHTVNAYACFSPADDASACADRHVASTARSSDRHGTTARASSRPSDLHPVGWGDPVVAARRGIARAPRLLGRAIRR